MPSALADVDNFVTLSPTRRRDNYAEDASFLRYFPQCSPADLSPVERLIRELDNPFPSEAKYAKARATKKAENGEINSYLKFVNKNGLNIIKLTGSSAKSAVASAKVETPSHDHRQDSAVQAYHRRSFALPNLNAGHIAGMSRHDKHLWDFCKIVFRLLRLFC